MKKLLAMAAISGLVLTVPATALAQSAETDEPAPPDRAAAPSARETGGQGAVPDRYIVTFRKGAPRAETRAARQGALARGGAIHFEYDSAVDGFAATLPGHAVEALRRNPHVDLIEPDRAFTVATTQTANSAGLDRIDQRSLPLNGSYTYNATGAGVSVYVIDTGVRMRHVEFAGRAVSGYDAVGDGRMGEDCNGHGTHVAGTIGGSTYGVAKQAKIVSVRVLDCNGYGTTSRVIAGIDWVTSHHVRPAVANLSLWGPVSSALDVAVKNSSAAGVLFTVAAGNDNADACTRSPGRVAEVVTVGSAAANDARSSWSNYGSCLDLFAPGASITSAWSTSDTATNTVSGTSMAAPHVAGVAALYLQVSPSSRPQEVRDAVVNGATSGVVATAGTGSPNRLLYSLLGSASVPAPTPVPDCNGETYPGTLSGTGDADLQPNGTYFQAGAGTHRACLAGPVGADFDLALYRWNGIEWVRVAVSQGTTSTETVAYSGVAGYYYWRVYSYSGAGTYTLRITRP